MLQARVILPPAAALAVGVTALLLSSCGGAAPRPIETLERTGVTAIEQSKSLACTNDRQVLEQAVQNYTLLEGNPPPDQAALVPNYLHEASKLFDVVNGQIVPVAVDCGGTGQPPATTPSGSPPMTAPATDLGQIVTSTEVPLTAQQMLAEFTPEEIAGVGGQECAGELASMFVAAQKYTAAQGKDPASIDDLAGYLDQPIDLWVVQDGSLVPAPGSSCVALTDGSAPPDQTATCTAEARSLEVAREAYFAQFGDATEPTQQDLVGAGLLREPEPDVDLSAGAVVAVAGGPCVGVDLGA
jgi:hypothetical protein